MRIDYVSDPRSCSGIQLLTAGLAGFVKKQKQKQK
jgi:hypothetical protein